MDIGRIVLDDPPALSELARDILTKTDGPSRFREIYGDFYVCGFELGAHASACLSVATKSTQTKDRLALAVKAKVLFFEAKAEVTSKTWESAEFSAKVTFVGYNTLAPTQPRKQELQAKTFADVMQLKSGIDQVLDGVASLDGHMRTAMETLGIEDGQLLDPSTCNALLDQSMVVGLILAPYARMEAYVSVLGTERSGDSSNILRIGAGGESSRRADHHGTC